jgi:hypothetical protein
MSKYCAVNIEEVINMEGKIPFDVYIRLSEEKIIKLEHEASDGKQRLVDYQKKGLTQVVVLKEQYLAHVKQFKENFSSKFFAPSEPKTTEQKVDALDKGFQIAKTTFKNIGFNEDAIELAGEVNKQSVELIKQTPNIFKFFMDFKEKASKDFLKAMLTSFTLTTIIDTFDWASEPIKEKSSMAVMLVDVLLEAHEIEVAKNREGIPKDKLDPKIVNHPLETSRILNKRGTTLPRETVIIIEQHHERPDGKGYPMGMNHTNINILAACYIVSCHFIDLLVVNQFKPEKKDEILTELFDEYAMGNYKKAVRALQKILG